MSIFGLALSNFSTTLMQLSLALLLCTTVFSLAFSLYSAVYKEDNMLSPSQTRMVINYGLTMSLVVHGLLFSCLFYFYLVSFIESSAGKNILRPIFVASNFSYFLFGYQFNVDLYGFILLFLAFFVGFFALLTSENKIKTQNANFYFYFNYFLLVVYLFVGTQDVFLLFICYELLLIPSFLFIFFISYTKKAIQASLYFVIWTQIGSLLVLMGLVYACSITGSSSFASLRLQIFKPLDAYIIYLLLFFGFGFKIPLWPFHYWLTKTHVEAPSGFSIYLSGFLVKSALYGFFKVTNVISFEINTIFFCVIAMIGVIDASFKMWGQSDLKKLVAYCTIQEMNLILFMFLIGDANTTLCGIIFSAAHAFLSALMFFIVDCIYRRFHTRSIFALQGLLQKTPNLSIVIFLMCILYAGLPGTIKFSCEFYIFATLLDVSWVGCLLLMFIVNVVGLIGFSKPWFNAIFGISNTEVTSNVLDLSKKEIYVILYIFLFFIFITYFSMLLL